MLGEYLDVWSGSLEKIGAAGLRIELTLEAKLIHRAPQRAEQRPRKVKDAKTTCTQNVGVTEPTMVEWANLPVFVSEKTADYAWTP